MSNLNALDRKRTSKSFKDIELEDLPKSIRIDLKKQKSDNNSTSTTTENIKLPKVHTLGLDRIKEDD